MDIVRFGRKGICSVGDNERASRFSGPLNGYLKRSLICGLALLVLVLGLSGTASAYGGETHKYIADQARDLYSNSSEEIDAYWASFYASTKDADDHDHVFDRSGAYKTVTHFWDADNGPGDPSDPCITGVEHNAWENAIMLWGMALGEYHSGDKISAYGYLGHVAHLLADMSVPAHAHEDCHPADGLSILDDDSYDSWMGVGAGTAILNQEEKDWLKAMGPIEVPDGSDTDKLYYLFYTTNQMGDFFPSDSYDGDTNDFHGGWMDEIYSELGMYSIGKPRTASHLENNDDDNDNDDGDLGVIRANSYFYSIRAVAALYKLFEETTNQDTALTVVIDEVNELECHDDLSEVACESGPDYFVEMNVHDTWFKNEGDQIEDDANINPGWAFGRTVGLSGTSPVMIRLWDEDELGTPGWDDDKSDIDPREGGRDLDLTVDLAKCIAFEPGAVSGDIGGACGATLMSEGSEDDRSRIYFRIIPPNAPPTANAGPDQTVNEGDLVTLSGSFTDPNVEDTHTFLWHLDSSTNGQAVSDTTTQSLTFTPIDNGVYTFSFTVTDNHGAQGSDSVVVTAENVAPAARIDSITDETGAKIGGDVPVALVGLEIDLAGSFTDAGTADTHTAQINWSDGNIDADTDFDTFNDSVGGITGTLNAAHIYTDPGTYTITLKVTDDDSGVGTTAAQIEVVNATGAIAKVVESLTSIADDPDIQAAIDKLQGEQDGKASNGALDMLEKGNLNAALEKIKQALEYLEAAEAADPSLDLTYDKGLLGLAAKSVVVNAITEAEEMAFKPNDLLKIQQAKDLVAQGDALLASHDYVGAVDKYQQAVREVQGTG